MYVILYIVEVDSMKMKSVVLSVIVLLIGLMIVGGTYAFMTIQANVTNTNYVGVSTCFLVDYNIDNGNGTQAITGTLFPSISPIKGLNGRVGLKINDNCDVNGMGTLKLHINSETDNHLTAIATSHCEDKKTGDILTEYATEASCSSAGERWKNYPTSYCEDNNTLQILKEYMPSASLSASSASASCVSNNGTWVTNGSPLKYAIYNSSNTNSMPVKVGHITSSNIGSDVTIYDNIVLTSDQRYFYVYIWLDGYLSDNTHSDLPFGGYINANAIQSDRLLPNEYEQVEYISSSGSQYIDTEISGNNNNLTFDIKYSWVTLPASGAYAYVIGAYENENSVSTRILQYGPSTTYFNINTKAGGGSGVYNVTRSVGTIYNELLSSSGTRLTYNSNGTVTNKDYVAGDDIDNNVCVFASSRKTAYSKIKLYYLKIHDGGNLVRDFIPCYRKSDGVRGLYDTVYGKFYTNAGSGTFGIPA